MIILEPIATAQQVSVYIRSSATNYQAKVVDEQTLVETSSTVTGTYSEGLFTFNLTHSFEDNRFYWLYVNDSDTSANLNKSKIFITDQSDLQVYSMPDDFYTTITKTKKRFYVRKD